MHNLKNLMIKGNQFVPTYNQSNIRPQAYGAPGLMRPQSIASPGFLHAHTQPAQPSYTRQETVPAKPDEAKRCKKINY